MNLAARLIRSDETQTTRNRTAARLTVPSEARPVKASRTVEPRRSRLSVSAERRNRRTAEPFRVALVLRRATTRL